jgi:hypothetical protein
MDGLNITNIHALLNLNRRVSREDHGRGFEKNPKDLIVQPRLGGPVPDRREGGDPVWAATSARRDLPV